MQWKCILFGEQTSQREEESLVLNCDGATELLHLALKDKGNPREALQLFTINILRLRGYFN